MIYYQSEGKNNYERNRKKCFKSLSTNRYSSNTQSE